MLAVSTYFLLACLVFSGAAKLVAPHQAAMSCKALTGADAALCIRAVYSLSSVELVLGIAITSPPTRRPAALITVTLALAFLGAFALSLFDPEAVECGCFGAVIPSPSTATRAALVAGLLISALIATQKSHQRTSPAPP